ncbi:MAG TPA: DUF1800 domain-containing protein [Terriglobales bacterium]|nr:DUF1800 domain-containing protein [Terriglobales bacterium]
MSISSTRRRFAIAAAIVCSAIVAVPAIGKKKPSTLPAMDEKKRALHALNRLSFGPRPGDLQEVMNVGVDHWIDAQLRPEKINDSALEARLAPFRTLRMSTHEIVESFPPPEVIREVQKGRRPLPSDPMERAVYQDQIERMEEKLDQQQAAVGITQGNAGGNDKINNVAMARDDNYGEMKAQQLLDLPPDQRVKEILRMSAEDRLALARSLKPNTRDELLDGMSAQQRETMIALNNPQQVVVDELVEGKILRETYSERQVQEVMTDFWLNHFNVYLGKGPDRYFLTSYERDVIRPHSMGKFEDLLAATAQSPAMLFYLDNWLSVGPDSDDARGVPKNPMAGWRRAMRGNPAKPPKNRNSGLNENYGRELMELHTLGVNGGYSQKDVTEVARVFTGWTIKQPRDGGGFTFEERMHEPGDKTVLGKRIKSNGEKEGFEVLHLLAHHPATAKFICTKLAMRFVSDDPPPALVSRMSQTFLKKDGDIREVLRTMLRSPEFWSNDAYRAKVKTPLEFVVSSLRASNAEVSDALPIAHRLQALGMPLYGMQPPTGYSMKADAWVNSSALLGRMNFALTLANGKLRGTEVDWTRLPGAPSANPHDVLMALEDDLLAGDVSQQTHETLVARLDDPKVSQRRLDDPIRPPDLAVLSGLILGSPEFQRR